MTVAEIITELDNMTSAQVAEWDTRCDDGIVDQAGEGSGVLLFDTGVTANAFDGEDSTSQIYIIGEVGTHVISQNQGGDPRE